MNSKISRGKFLFVTALAVLVLIQLSFLSYCHGQTASEKQVEGIISLPTEQEPFPTELVAQGALFRVVRSEDWPNIQYAIAGWDAMSRLVEYKTNTMLQMEKQITGLRQENTQCTLLMETEKARSVAMEDSLDSANRQSEYHFDQSEKQRKTKNVWKSLFWPAVGVAVVETVIIVIAVAK
jgi:hypothetical protein